MTTTFKTGDAVRFRLGGRAHLGRVALASPNGRSLAITFEGMAVPAHGEGAYAGLIPVLMDDAGVFHDLVSDEVVEVEFAPVRGA